jgi:hypothetical protein
MTDKKETPNLSASRDTKLNEDKIWIALMTSLTALTDAMHFASGDNYVDQDEVLQSSARAIRRITDALDDYNL